MVDDNITDDMLPEKARGRLLVGSAERIAEQLQTKVLDAGVDGVIVNMATKVQGYRPGLITALGEALRPRVGA